MIAYHAWVSGRVQGVFFRDSTRRRALELGLTGWVRNLTDGRVECIFSGAGGEVEAMCLWLREGPSAARVDDVQLREIPPESWQGFEVRADA